jgi:hypothetical protein
LAALSNFQCQNTFNQSWGRTGAYITAVDADSAILQLPDHTEDKIPLDADHSQIVKFNSKNDKGYRSVVERLKQFQHDATSVVTARFSK